MCVHDLDKAIADWTDILSVLSPEHAMRLTRGGGEGDGVPMIWATFQNPDPEGCSIQLWAPGRAGHLGAQGAGQARGVRPPHRLPVRRLRAHGASSAATPGCPCCWRRTAGPDTMPWLAWNFIGEEKAHGVLIELATRYQAVGDKWMPHPGNAENAAPARRARQALLLTGAAPRSARSAGICNALCGIVVTTDGDRVPSVRGDPDHPISHGYTCSKGRSLPGMLHHPDRLEQPLRRGADGELHPVGWDEALDSSGRVDPLDAVADDGPSAVGGLPRHALGLRLQRPGGRGAVPARARYPPDLQLGHHRHPEQDHRARPDGRLALRLPGAGLGRARNLLLFFGQNPVVSHGHVGARPDAVSALRAIQPPRRAGRDRRPAGDRDRAARRPAPAPAPGHATSALLAHLVRAVLARPAGPGLPRRVRRPRSPCTAASRGGAVRRGGAPRRARMSPSPTWPRLCEAGAAAPPVVLRHRHRRLDGLGRRTRRNGSPGR